MNSTKRMLPKSGPARKSGFTLIEMMIVVAIIGILAAIAYPSYTEQVRRGKRSDVETVMMQGAQFMQRAYAARSSFSLPDDETWSKSGFAAAPLGATEDTITYEIELAVNDNGRSFVLTATPKQTDDKCGKLTLSDTGQKGSEKGSVADCWK